MKEQSITLLGNSEAKWPQSPEEATLDTFPNRTPEREYWIMFDYPEFCSLCPVTGQPDTARIKIRYIPNEKCVETKSLKFYLSSFRNHPNFNEDIVNRILTDLSSSLQPKKMTVKGDFSPRGGIQLTAQASYPDNFEPLEID